MGVHFVYRSGYENPLGHRLKSYDDRDMLAWFQRHWLRMEDVPAIWVEWTTGVDGDKYFDIDFEFLAKRTDAVFGMFVYGFEAVWTSMAQNSVPRSNEDLVNWLKSIDYPEGQVFARHHALQAITDDDERELVVMMFDDHFAEADPGRVSFLLHNELDLPTKSLPSIGEFHWSGSSELLVSAGCSNNSTYCIFIVLEDSAWLSPPKGVFRFNGIELSSLAEELRKPVGLNHEDWPSELRMLRCIAIRNPELSTSQALDRFVELEPFDNASIFDAWQSGNCIESRFLGSEEKVELEFSEIAERLQQRIDPENTNHSKQISDHLVRIGYHVEDPEDYRNSFHLAMYFFDDVWAQANPDLATSLLHYGSEGMCLFGAECVSS